MTNGLYDIPQGTMAWKDFRRKGLGSSDIPIIMGESEYKTPYELYWDKLGLGQEDEDSYAAKRGKSLESIAREHYELETGISMRPFCVVHPDHPHMRASLDGLNTEVKVLLEIKNLLNKDMIQMAKDGKVPRPHYLQMQHQLMVSKAYCNLGHYWSFDGESKGYLVLVEPDQKLQEEIFQKASEFWERVQKQDPPPPTETDFFRVTAPGLAEYIERYRRHKEQEDEAKRSIEALKPLMEKHMVHPKIICNGMKLQRVSRKGNINYKDVPELGGVDLEQYRGKDSSYILFSDTKK